MARTDLKADSVEELSKGIAPAKEKNIDEVVVDLAAKEILEDASEKKAEEAKATSAPKKRGRPRKIDEMSTLEAITLHAQRNTHSIERASKEEKKTIYASEHVFVEDGDTAKPIVTDATIRREEWLELVASAETGRILKGVIESITEIPSDDYDDENYIPEFMAKVRFKTGKFTVNIPSFVLYDYEYKNMNRAMAMDIQKNMMRRLGAEIDFVVRFTREADGYVIGDRLQALNNRGLRYYTSQNGRKPQIIPGMIVQAKIIAIAREYITVDACGAEFRIPLEEISWLYNADARDFDGIKTAECYMVGEPVNVKILTAEVKKVKKRNTAYTIIEATGSIKQAQPNPRLKYFNEFNIGDIHAGVITGITESGVYVNLSNKMDCLCKFPRSGRRMPVMGESVIVQIFAKDEEKKFLYGNLK